MLNYTEIEEVRYSQTLITCLVSVALGLMSAVVYVLWKQ